MISFQERLLSPTSAIHDFFVTILRMSQINSHVTHGDDEKIAKPYKE